MSGPPTRPTLDRSWPHPVEPPTVRPSLSRSHPHLPPSSLLPLLAAASTGALRPHASFLVVGPSPSQPTNRRRHPDLPPTDRSSARPHAGPVRRPGSRAGHRRAALPRVGRRPLHRPSSAAPVALLCVTRVTASPRRHRVPLASAARERPRSRPLLLATSPTSASSPPSPSAPIRVAVAPLSSDGALLPLFWPPPAPTDIARPHQCLPRARAATPPSSSPDPALPLGFVCVFCGCRRQREAIRRAPLPRHTN